MKIQRKNIAILVALLFHISGAMGILFSPYKDWFVQNTPLNLCLMAALLIYTQEQKNKWFYFFATLAFTTGIITEIIGVNTGYLFGNYKYGSVMGVKLKGVPLLIGVQWFMTVFCCGSIVHQLHQWIEKKYEAKGVVMSPKIQFVSLIIDSALLATTFDFIMEPIAVDLHFWQWENNTIPFYNYVCWFLISLALMIIFKTLSFKKENHFAIHLFIIQTLFFLILRTFL